MSDILESENNSDPQDLETGADDSAHDDLGPGEETVVDAMTGEVTTLSHQEAQVMSSVHELVDGISPELFNDPYGEEQLSTSKEDIILDSFAGSGTTAQAVLELNKEDGGNRKFILVELEPEICKKITSERVKKVIKGYDDVSGTGGGFQYAVLDKKLFNADGRINPECTFEELASYVYFTETKTILDTKPNKTLLDTHNETQIHLMFAGVGKNNLDRKFLTSLDQEKNKVIYADKCTLDDSTLEKHNTIFKQIPYEVREF